MSETRSPEAYYCSRHGDVTGIPPLTVFGAGERHDGHYCGACYADMLVAHCQRVAVRRKGSD